MEPNLQRGFRLHGRTVLPQQNRITGDGDDLHVVPRTMAVLVCLAEHAGEVVTREFLDEHVWHGSVVTDHALTSCISELRNHLGDGRRGLRFIETIPKRGYRLVAPVLPLAEAAGPAVPAQPAGLPQVSEPTEPTAPAGRPHPRRVLRVVLPAGLAVVVVAFVGAWWATHAGIGVRGAASTPASQSAASGAATAGTAVPPAPTVAAMPIPAKSVAVLPFANESGEQDQRYFSDGLSDDLITALSQFDGLKVISRNSAFQFRDSPDSSAKIGRALGVAHLLEGTVQRAGDEVRITATLVDAASGAVLWSQRYDKPYQDLFALQDAITHSVARALRTKLLIGPGVVLQTDRPPGGRLDAYLAYQRGMAHLAVGTEADKRDAIKAFTEAIRIDPHYAVAYATMGHTWNGLVTKFLGGAEAVAAEAEARTAIDTALRLDPDSALAHEASAFLLMTVDMDRAGAEAEARRALQLSPNSAVAKRMLATVLSTEGHHREAHALAMQAMAVDPRSAGAYDGLSIGMTSMGRLHAARRAIDTAITLQPRTPGFRSRLTMIEVLAGNHAAAMAAAKQELPGVWRDFALALAMQGGSDRAAADAALNHLIASDAGDSAYQIAEVYALRGDPDHMFEWLDRAWANRDPGINALLGDPFILRYERDPRFAAFCKTVGLPTTTDAVAMQ